MQPPLTSEEGAARRRLPAVVALAAANAIMAISQVNIASIYLPISVDFHQTLYGLGLLTAIYFAGYGAFEIPGSIAAAKVGPKKMILLGGTLTGLAVASGALSPNFWLLALFRLLAGVGFGLLFPPTLVLMIRNLGGRSVGMGAALATISFSLGGSAGILGWSILSAWSGWRLSLLVESVVTLSSILVVALVVPGDELRPEFRVRLSHLKDAVTDRSTIAVALSVFGGGATANLAGSFMVYYLEETFGMPPASAGLIGAVTYIGPLATGLFVGRLYDRGISAKVLLASSAVSLTAGTAMVAYPSVYTALIGSLAAGLGVGAGGTAAFSVARDLAGSPEYESLNVSIVDAASLVGLFASPLYFAAIAASSGYPAAWLVGSLAAVVFFVPVLLVRIERKAARASTAGSAH